MVRRPLLILWLVALASVEVVLEQWTPQPWSALTYVVIMPVGVVSVASSVERHYSADDGQRDS